MSSGGDKLFAALLAVPRVVRAAIAGRRFRRELAGVPHYALDELPEGMRGRVTGVARPLGAVLEAPLSGRTCVYYRIAIEELRGGLANELASEQEAVSFVLDDRGHCAVIDPVHATVSAEFDHASTSLAAFDADAAQRSLLERHALVVRDWFWTDSLRYREAVIALDEPTAVVGIGTREPDPEARPAGQPGDGEGAYRDGGASRLWLRGSRRFPLVISDDPAARGSWRRRARGRGGGRGRRGSRRGRRRGRRRGGRRGGRGPGRAGRGAGRRAGTSWRS